MLTHKLLRKKLQSVLVTGLGIAAVFAVGCSSTGSQSRAHTQLPSAINNKSLAASDGIGLVVFGTTTTAVEPRLPKNWKLATAAPTH